MAYQSPRRNGRDTSWPRTLHAPSGQWRGKSFVGGSRTSARKALFMGAMRTKGRRRGEFLNFAIGFTLWGEEATESNSCSNPEHYVVRVTARFENAIDDRGNAIVKTYPFNSGIHVHDGGDRIITG